MSDETDTPIPRTLSPMERGHLRLLLEMQAMEAAIGDGDSPETIVRSRLLSVLCQSLTRRTTIFKVLVVNLLCKKP